MSDKCNYTKTVSVHPSVKIGGATVYECNNDTVPGMTVCYEHANKEALVYYIQTLLKENKDLRSKLVRLDKKDIDAFYDEEPGRLDCYTDYLQNKHFDSIGGLHSRRAPEVPDYIPPDKSNDYLKAYFSKAYDLYGPDYLYWSPTFTLY